LRSKIGLAEAWTGASVMKDGSICNLRTWKKQDIIDEYAASTELQPPEKAILDTLRDQLRK
jgi:hypothetical protein